MKESSEFISIRNASKIQKEGNSNGDFNHFAKKLRLDKIDKNAIMQYKSEAINLDKFKKKKHKSVVYIQKIIRGYILRRKFKNMLERINILTIIEYFKQKRLERIHENAIDIISYHINEYIERKRESKRKIYMNYMNYCANLIMKFWRGHYVRTFYEEDIQKFKYSKMKIYSLLLGNKVRSIIRITKMQDILSEIANIKNFFDNMHRENRVSEKTEKLKEEFKRKLPKLQLNFYNEFYKLYDSGKWVQYSRTNTCWLKYLNILKGLLEPPRKMRGSVSPNRSVLKRNQSRDINEPSQERNENYKTSNTQMLDKSDRKITEYDDKPINSGTKKNYDISKLQEFPLEDVIENNQNKDKEYTEAPEVKENPKRPAKIKRQKPKYDARKAIEEAKLKEANKEKEIIKEKSGEEKTQAKRINKFNREEEEIVNKVEEINEVSKEKKIELKSNEKVPDYNNISREDFKYDDLKEMKEESNLQTIKQLKDGLRKTKEDKVLIGKSNEIQGGAGTGLTLSLELKKDKDGKPLRKDIELRKKLHELERSPPKKIDVKNVKSKVECWGQEGTSKKNKKSEDIINNFELIEDSRIPNDFLSDLYNIYSNIETHFSNLDTFFNQKAESLENYNIPIINSNSFYVQHFSNDIYEELKGHINKHYQEIKN